MSDFNTTFERIFKECSLEEYLPYAEKFRILANHLVLTNEKYNLTAITDDEGVILRHFADSLTAVKHIPKGAKVIDVGAGGGFPSLPIAIVRDDLKITSLDSTAKKLEFIKEAAELLSLDNITTVAARAEEVGREELRESFDVSISRAVARLSILSELCLPLTRVGGLFIAMKGADSQNELDEAEKGIKILGGELQYKEGFTLSDAGERCIIVCRKNSSTQAKYPRAYAKIKKSPL